MKIQLLAFGPAKEWIGNRHEEIDIPEGMTLPEFFNHLKEKFPNLPESDQFSIALNQNYIHSTEEIVLKENDEIAIIPPVSGG